MTPTHHHHQGTETSPSEHVELDDHEGADAFETAESVRATPRKGSSERQDEEIISLDTPD